MTKYKELPGIEYLADRSNTDSDWYDYDISWYLCNHCHYSFMYDYGKSQRRDPNFYPVCGAPNEPVLIRIWGTNDD